MDSLLDLGIQIILVLQSTGEWSVPFLKTLTFLGNKEFYLLIAPVLLWCVDYSIGLRVGIFLTISGAVNSILKLTFHSPRPYWYDPRINTYGVEETSFGIPSGHAQNAVVVWGSLAASIRKRWVWIAASILALLIGYSRIALGVHFPIDVLTGWLIGLLLLWFLIYYEQRLIAWLEKRPASDGILLSLGASLLLILVGAIVRLALGQWILPESWVLNAALIHPDPEPINPLALSGLVTPAATFFGLSAGAIIIRNRGGFDSGGTLWKRITRFILGIIGVLLLWSGLGTIFPDGDSVLAISLRYLRYTSIGLWITFVAPVLFIRLKLAKGTKAD